MIGLCPECGEHRELHESCKRGNCVSCGCPSSHEPRCIDWDEIDKSRAARSQEPDAVQVAQVDLEALEAKLASDVDPNNGRHYQLHLVDRAALISLIAEVRLLRASKSRLLVASVRLAGDSRLADELAKTLGADA